MASLTRWERFEDARLQYNRHGKQTMDEASNGSGVSKGIIQALESEKSNRGVSYESIAKLADYYGVSADWLLGLSEEAFRDPCSIDELGITTKSEKILLKMQPGIFDDLINDLIEISDSKSLKDEYRKLKEAVSNQNQILFHLNSKYHQNEMKEILDLTDKMLELQNHGFRVLSPDEVVEYYATRVGNEISKLLHEKYAITE